MITKKRFFEMIPAFLSWSLLIFPVITSIYSPVLAIFFLSGFVFFWFFRSFEYVIFLLYSYYIFKKTNTQCTKTILNQWENNPEALSDKYYKKYTLLEKKGDLLMPSDVIHLVIVATCGESIEILRDTFLSLQSSQYDVKKIHVVLATEARMQPESSEIASQILSEFNDVFGGVYTFAHPDGIEGEVRGKGGNITHSGREAYKALLNLGINPKNVVVTTLDADNRVDSQYFLMLTLSYISEEDRLHKSYQPLPLFYNNIWEVPAINRLISLSIGFVFMVESARSYRLNNFASHAQPLYPLIDMDFWAVDTIVEDGHQYWRSYFHFSGKYSVIPLFVPIYQDAVQDDTWWSTTVAQYKQIRRWAWGASDIPYVLLAWEKEFKNVPFFETFLHFMRLLESHIFRAVGAIVVTLATPLPEFLNPQYATYGYATSVSEMLSFFFQITLFGIVFTMFLSFITLPRPKKFISYIYLVMQWVLTPLITIIMGSIPALDAQTRLFFGRYLGFNVTQKVRKHD